MTQPMTDYIKERAELLCELVKALVDYPEEVSILTEQTEFTVIMNIQVTRPDVGRVIGKGGCLVNALRHIINAGQGPRDQFLVLEVEDGDFRPMPSTNRIRLSVDQATELLDRAWTFYNRALGAKSRKPVVQSRANDTGVLVELLTQGLVTHACQPAFACLFAPVYVLAGRRRMSLYVHDGRSQLKPESCYSTLVTP